MSKTIEIQLFTIQELSEEARQKALAKLREFNDDSDSIAEDFAQTLKEKGYPTDDIRFRLSSCQGDGVAFYGSIDAEGKRIIAKRLLSPEAFDRVDSIKDEFGESVLGLSNFTINRDGMGRYNHWNTMSVEVESESDSPDITGLEKLIDAEIKDISRQLENDGYAQIDYAESDAVLIETADANEWTFEADGRMRNA